MPIEDWLKNFTAKQIEEGRAEFFDGPASDTMSLPQFMYKKYGGKKAEGGVTLDFEEGEVASSMFNGGAAIRGRNFSGNY